MKRSKRNIVITEKKAIREVIADELLDFIKKNNFWGKRLPSQRELSESLNVGLISINKAIKILQDLGICVSYHKKGTFVVKQNDAEAINIKRNKMLIIYPWDTSIPNHLNLSSESSLIAPIIRACNEKDIDIMFARLDSKKELEDEKYILKEYSPNTFNYVVFTSVFKNHEQIIRIAKHYNTAVMLDHYIEGNKLTGITEDGYGGMQQLTQHLIDQGHKRIAFINISNPDYNPWKFNGFLHTLKQNGLELPPKYVINVRHNPEAIDEFIKKVMSESLPPTAFICFDDQRAIYAKDSLNKLGYNVGNEVALAGYGDLAWKNNKDVEITSIRFEINKIGEAAVDYLFDNTKYKTGDQIKIKTELIIRKSTEKKFR